MLQNVRCVSTELYICRCIYAWKPCRRDLSTMPPKRTAEVRTIRKVYRFGFVVSTDLKVLAYQVHA